MSIPDETARYVEIELDGRRVQAEPGISVAAALMRRGHRYLRDSPQGNRRGAFCMMGVCQECVIQINGRLAQACLTPIVEGLRIVTGDSR